MFNPLLLLWLMIMMIINVQPKPIIDCSQNTLNQCLSPFNELSIEMSFPISFDELNETCKIVQQSGQCTEQFMVNCAKHDQHSMFGDIVNGTDMMMEEICEPGPLQNRYLQNAECYRETIMSECLSVIQSLGKLMMINEQQSIDKEQSLKHFCCSFQEAVDCQIVHISQSCPNGIEFFRKYVRQMSNRLLTEHCLTYTFNNQCTIQVEPDPDDQNSPTMINRMETLNNHNNTVWLNQISMKSNCFSIKKINSIQLLTILSISITIIVQHHTLSTI
ncbi:hypothetical protein BLOT_014698 [Blomia tropicalis]|nr:hypothetical protein BLOT_014698 [Blomia tropicalis]